MKKSLQEYKDQFNQDVESLFSYLLSNDITFEVKNRTAFTIDISMSKKGTELKYWCDTINIGNYWKELNSGNYWGGDYSGKDEKKVKVGFFSFILP